jgi:hypothetical protein
MIAVATEEMHGSDRESSRPETDYERAWVGKARATSSTRAKWLRS